LWNILPIGLKFVLRFDRDFLSTNNTTQTLYSAFAKQTMNGEPSNLPLVTGAKGRRILGAIYQIDKNIL
jgi:1,6-anhydro-N-acetylmuramate kinase